MINCHARTEIFLFIPGFRSQHFHYIVHFLECHCRIEFRVRFGINRSHQCFHLLFGQPPILMRHIFRSDFFIFLYGFLNQWFGTCRSFSCHFRVFQIDNLGLADNIVIVRRRGLHYCCATLVSAIFFLRLAFFLAFSAFSSRYIRYSLRHFHNLIRAIRIIRQTFSHASYICRLKMNIHNW